MVPVMPVVVPFAMEVPMTRQHIVVIAMPNYLGGMPIVVASVMPIVVRAGYAYTWSCVVAHACLRVVGAGVAVTGSVIVATAVWVSKIDMAIRSTDMDAKAAAEYLRLRVARIEAHERDCRYSSKAPPCGLR